LDTIRRHVNKGELDAAFEKLQELKTAFNTRYIDVSAQFPLIVKGIADLQGMLQNKQDWQNSSKLIKNKFSIRIKELVNETTNLNMKIICGLPIKISKRPKDLMGIGKKTMIVIKKILKNMKTC